MKAVRREDTVYVALDDLRGVPLDGHFYFSHWLLPARFVSVARAKGEVVRFPGFFPVCRVCGATISKETKAVVRFQFQEIHSDFNNYFSPLGKRRRAYLHTHTCLAEGKEVSDSLTNRELRDRSSEYLALY